MSATSCQIEIPKSRIQNGILPSSLYRPLGSYEYRRQLIGFPDQLFQPSQRYQPALDKQLHPKRRLIRFLLRHRQLVYKISLRPGPTCGTVIRRDRCPRTQQLIPKSATYKIFRQRARQFNHSQRKHFGPLFHFGLGHNFCLVVFKTISTRVPERNSLFKIQNPKSKIQN